ncbi:MAG: hypothetical protein ABI746_07410 [Dermatophilaceae bacterium]
MSDQSLDAEFAATSGRLDVHTRAWVIGVGRLTSLQRSFERAELRPVVGSAFDSGAFPSGPFPFTPGLARFATVDRRQEAVAQFDLDAQRRFEYRVGIGGQGLLSVALTRSGCLDDGTAQPSHVMLSDVESVLSDTIVLLECMAGELDDTGPRRLMIGVASDVPGEDVELRAFDEDGGDTLRPAAGYNEFPPIVVEYPGRLDPDETDRLLWETALSISLAFGVFVPQMVGQAKTRSAYQFGVIAD